MKKLVLVALSGLGPALACAPETRPAALVVPAVSVAPCVDTRPPCEACAPQMEVHDTLEMTALGGPTATATATAPIATATAPTTSATAPTASATAPRTGAFDRGAAATALAAIARSLRACVMPGDPTGAGHVTITFAPSGRATSARVDGPPFAGTTAGGCVARKFGAAVVPPFTGADITVGKSFEIPP